jgi:hypothetical protein
MSIRNSQFLICNCTALVAANRELITRFEQKIQAILARIWGEETPDVGAVDVGD